jgi:hypothetical protein
MKLPTNLQKRSSKIEIRIAINARLGAITAQSCIAGKALFVVSKNILSYIEHPSVVNKDPASFSSWIVLLEVLLSYLKIPIHDSSDSKYKN